MDYIGISSGFHDAALSVVDDNGNILFASHNERYTKSKHDSEIGIDIVKEAMTYVNGDEYEPRNFLFFARGDRGSCFGSGPKIVIYFLRDI